MASKKEKYPKKQLKLARYSKALSHPSRLLILKFLEVCGTSSFGTISSVLPISKASTAQHLTVLKDSGLVNCKSNPPYMFYTINSKAWEDGRKMMETFFSPMGREEFENMAIFLGKNAPELVKITTSAIETDRTIIENLLTQLQSRGLVEADVDFKNLPYDDLKAQAMQIAFNK